MEKANKDLVIKLKFKESSLGLKYMKVDVLVKNSEPVFWETILPDCYTPA